MFRHPLSDAMDLDLKDAVIGLDLGSSATRVVIRTLDESPKYFHVEDKDNTLCGRGSRFDTSDFSSTGYPFEDVAGPVYCPSAGPEVLQGRLPVSLKYGMYLLANASSELLKEYPAVQHVCALSSDAGFCARARRGLVELLTKVLGRVQSQCQNRGLRITRVALTVPVQWTLEFEDVYASIMTDALANLPKTKGGSIFAIDKDDIYFVTETEALAAYMFDHELDIDRPAEYRMENKSAYILFFDFGGHNMNGCGMFVKRSGTASRSQDKAEQIGFFTCFESFGSGGGSEHWECLMGRRCCGKISERFPGTELDKEAWTDMMDIIHKKKSRMGPPDYSTMTKIGVSVGDTSCTICLQPREINNDWGQAFTGVLDVVCDKLEAFRKAVPDGVDCTVVMSGGSANNAALQKHLIGAVDLYSLPAPIFTSGSDHEYGSARIARGAASIIGNLRSVKQFFDSGAAIGIQKRPGGFSANMSNPSLGWETWSKLVFANNTFEVIVKSDGTDDFKLICEPFFARSKRPAPSQKINLDGCYDVVYLGRRAAGQWRVRVSLEVVDGEDKLVIKMSHVEWFGSAWTRYPTLRLPVHFVAGTNTVIVGERGKTLDETLERLGLVVPKNPDGSDNRGGGEADDVVVDLGDVSSEDEQESVHAKEADGGGEYQPTDGEDARGTRSLPNRRISQHPGRFTATPVRAAAKKSMKRTAALAFLNYEEESD